MFTLAQYVFGTGRQIENSNNNQNHQQTLDLNPTSQQQQQLPLSFCFESDNKTNEPTLTNIENDWILIDVNDDNVGKDAQKNAKTKSKKSQTSNQKSSKEEKAQITNDNERNGKDKSENRMDNDDVLIEQPTMNVFDNLFVKKPPPPPPPVEATPTTSNVVIAKSLSTMNKAEQRKLILSKIQQSSSKNNKKADNNGSSNQNNKENQSSINNTKTNKKMKKTKSQRNAETMVINHVPTATIPAASSSSPLAINGSINKKAFTAIVAKDKCLRKLNISKKRNERQNKVAINRNGPMIRQKKMFIHINGILNNRKNC